MISCPKCNHELIWAGDNNIEDNDNFLVMSCYHCPDCKTEVNVNWSEHD